MNLDKRKLMKISILQTIIFLVLLTFSYKLGIKAERIRVDHNVLGMKIHTVNLKLQRIIKLLRASSVNPHIIKELEDLGYTI